MEPNPSPPAAPPTLFSEALQFVLSVKREFAGEPEKYQAFLDVLSESKSIGMAATILRIRAMFAGYPHLLRGFDMFMPRGNN